MNSFFAQRKTTANQAGFSLVETLVSISILLTVVSSIMLLVSQSVQSGGQLSDQLKASYLASDAIEYIRHDRDSHLLADNDHTFDGWASNFGCGGTCKIDTRIGGAGASACGGTCDYLYYDSGSKRYSHQTGSGWEQTKFRREVSMTYSNVRSGSATTSGATIKVKVKWTGPNGRDSSLKIKDFITAWGE